jgi:hypothetical protein
VAGIGCAGVALALILGIGGRASLSVFGIGLGKVAGSAVAAIAVAFAIAAVALAARGLRSILGGVGEARSLSVQVEALRIRNSLFEQRVAELEGEVKELERRKQALRRSSVVALPDVEDSGVRGRTSGSGEG